MIKVTALSKLVSENKEKFALAFSLLALIASFGKNLIDVFVPTTHLTVIVSEPDKGEDQDPFRVSEDNDNLRIDPRLQFSFINGSSHQVLVRFIELVSPQLNDPHQAHGSSNTFNMHMIQFEYSNGATNKATPFTIGSGEIVPLQINFAGMPGLKKGTNLFIPIDIHLETFDFKGRKKDFQRRAFEITSIVDTTNGLSLTYNLKIEDKGVAVLRFSQFWSFFH